MSDEKYDHDRWPTIAISVGDSNSIELVPWWPMDIIEPYLHQPTNSPTLIIANLRGCCSHTIEYLQQQVTAASLSASRTCPHLTCGQRINGHIPEAEMRTACRAHRAMFPAEWGPRTLIESVRGGWEGVGRGRPGSGPVAAAQSAFTMAGGVSSMEAAVAAAEEANKAAVEANPLSVGGVMPMPLVTTVSTVNEMQQSLPMARASASGSASASTHAHMMATADSPSVKPSLSEWNSLEKLVQMCSKLQWQRGITIAYEYIETLEEQLDTIAVPPTTYVYFLNMMFDKVKHDHMIKWVKSTLISPGEGKPSLSWNECKSAFIKQYGDVNAMTILRDRLRNLTQGRASVQEYSEEFQRLTRRLGDELKDDNKSNMDAYLRGLNPDIRAWMVNVRKNERNRPGGDKDWDWPNLTELCLATINTAAIEADAKHLLHSRDNYKPRVDHQQHHHHEHGIKRKADNQHISKPTGLHCPKHPHLDNHTWDNCIQNPKRKQRNKLTGFNKNKKFKTGASHFNRQQRPRPFSSSRSHLPVSAWAARARSHSTSSSSPASTSSPTTSTKPHVEKSDKKVNFSFSVTNVTCYNCGEKGHLASACPKRKGQGGVPQTHKRHRGPAVRSVMIASKSSPRGSSQRARAQNQ